ncbi:unnamed protein product [Paramecium sonneborni]|uniref:Uncharacterized protein n=1 Tax=Paramecium sonneborni TaxID=65129 RepID=A0A8S1LM33_9CILI|nr:unnamed protein product [Paramecium sonneborni]
MGNSNRKQKCESHHVGTGEKFLQKIAFKGKIRNSMMSQIESKWRLVDDQKGIHPYRQNMEDAEDIVCRIIISCWNQMEENQELQKMYDREASLYISLIFQDRARKIKEFEKQLDYKLIKPNDIIVKSIIIILSIK